MRLFASFDCFLGFFFYSNLSITHDQLVTTQSVFGLSLDAPLLADLQAASQASETLATLAKQLR
jgi:hypothetical protein